MKLNIGCGKRYEPDYYNIDLYEPLIADNLMSALNLDFEDNSSEEIKAIHVIEHLTFFEAIYALSEFYRVLKTDGKLIIETPNLRKACQHYLEANNKQKKQILGWFYGVPQKGLQHKLCFPSFLLVELLENRGFGNISTFNFYNDESIPTVKFECFKKVSKYQADIYQILAKLRKQLFLDNRINLNNSFLAKEQEDIYSFIGAKLDEIGKTEKKDFILCELLIELITKWPDVVKPLLIIIQNLSIIDQTQIILLLKEVSELLMKVNLVKIRYNTIFESPINPGTQKLVLYLAELYCKRLVEKVLYSKQERDIILGNLVKINKKSEEINDTIFSAALLEKKAYDLYYLGIKSYYNEDFVQAHNFFLKAIKFNRDNYLFFWNLGKTLVKLNSLDSAKKIYKKTLRLIKITKIQNKQQLKKQVKSELYLISKEGVLS